MQATRHDGHCRRLEAWASDNTLVVEGRIPVSTAVSARISCARHEITDIDIGPLNTLTFEQ